MANIGVVFAMLNPSPGCASVTRLRALVETSTQVHRVLPFGVECLDAACHGGLRAGALHEVSASSPSLADDAAATLFATGVAARSAHGSGAPVLWVGTRDDLYAPGLEQAGLAAADVIHVRPRDDASVLSVIEDAARDGTPAAIVGEVGRMSMVATRRLQLVAADADILILVLRRRRSREHDPLAEPSAAWSRWRIAAAPSAPLDVSGVGRARWLVELARQRGGEPFSMIVEGCDATGRLAVPAEPGRRAAAAVGTAVRAAA